MPEKTHSLFSGCCWISFVAVFDHSAWFYRVCTDAWRTEISIGSVLVLEENFSFSCSEWFRAAESPTSGKYFEFAYAVPGRIFTSACICPENKMVSGSAVWYGGFVWN